MGRGGDTPGACLEEGEWSDRGVSVHSWGQHNLLRMAAPLEDRVQLQLIAVPDVMFSEECLINASISRKDQQPAGC